MPGVSGYANGGSPLVVASLKEVGGERGNDSDEERDEERDEEAEVLQERTGEAATLFFPPWLSEEEKEENRLRRTLPRI